MKKVLAIDMGATSIRGILSYIEDGFLKTEEVMRFSHRIIKKDGRKRWQWKELLEQIVSTIEKYAKEIDSVGIDTWGVDFGLLDKDGNLLEDPMSYRDEKHNIGYEYASSLLSEEEIFKSTGTQIMNINTLFQLLSIKKENPDLFEKIDKVLLLPDLIQYLLCGEVLGEETIWSTTQILNLETKTFDEAFLNKLGINKNILPNIVEAGHISGSTKNSKIEKLRKYDIKVISVCGHDTASAVLLTSSFTDEKTMFLSAGTWSLFGGLVRKAVLSQEAYESALTNELGFSSKTMFFKNLTGLYLLEKYKKELEKRLDRSISFEEIREYILKNPKNPYIIDIEYKDFSNEDMGAKDSINRFLGLKDTEINDMDYFSIIYDSLVDKYFKVKEKIEDVTGVKYEKVHIIGGGAKSDILCNKIKDKLGLPVFAGPFEASALGNILVQLLALGEIVDIKEGLDIVYKSEKTFKY